jgi:hypothetical protein
MNEVVVERVVRSPQDANMNREGTRLPGSSQLILVRLPSTPGEQQ